MSLQIYLDPANDASRPRSNDPHVNQSTTAERNILTVYTHNSTKYVRIHPNRVQLVKSRMEEMNRGARMGRKKNAIS